MEAAVRLQNCNLQSNVNNKKCLLYLSEILPPSYSDTLIQKCLKYYGETFGQEEILTLEEILKISSQEQQSKHRTFHSVTYNGHIYIGELDAKGNVS